MLKKIIAISRSHVVSAEDEIKNISQWMLTDGIQMIVNIEESHGARVLARVGNGTEEVWLIDFHGGFRSSALGWNHPGFSDNFIVKLGKAVINKKANPDFYSLYQLDALKTIAELWMTPAGFKKMFLIDGGALANENAIKTAIRNKVLTNISEGRGEKGKTVIGAYRAFHGRSGLTMPLTRTDPGKSEFMPKFDWPAFHLPQSSSPDDIKDSLTELEALIKKDPEEIAAVMVEDAIQCEGGDHFIPVEFYNGLRKLADQYKFYVIYDGVQTGFFVTGYPFAFQAIGAPQPDIISFAKKASIGGIFVSDSILNVEENAIEVPSKINSTWGGNYSDLLVCAKKLKIIKKEKLDENAEKMGKFLLKKLEDLVNKYPRLIENARGIGLLCAVSFKKENVRDWVIDDALKNGVILLGGGVPEKASKNLPYKGQACIRFGLNLAITQEEIEQGLAALDQTFSLVPQSLMEGVK